jgi:hypothetical protein
MTEVQDHSSTYEIGYGRPPKHTRWKKGQSGNPFGRKKGHLSEKALFLKTANKKVVVQGPRGSKRVTMWKALFMTLFDRGMRRDTAFGLQALNMLNRLDQIDSPPDYVVERRMLDVFLKVPLLVDDLELVENIRDLDPRLSEAPDVGYVNE